MMDFILAAWAWWQGNEALILGALAAILAIAMAIPGDHPDKELQWLLDNLKKLSRKKKK